MCGVSLGDRIPNEEICRMVGTSENVTVRMKKNVEKRVNKDRMAKKDL